MSKVGRDVYAICDKCYKPIKTGEEIIILTKRIVGEHGQHRQGDLCIECFNKLELR